MYRIPCVWQNGNVIVGNEYCLRPGHQWKCLREAGNLSSLGELLTISHSKWAQLLFCCSWPCRNDIVRKGFIQGKEKEKMLPTPFRMLASITHLTTRENGGVKGASDFTPHLYSSQAQEQEERMAACRRLVTPRVPQLFGSSKNESFTRVAGAQWRVLSVAAVLQCAPYPQYSVFSHQWEASW